jgi:hypothetical protein
MKAHLAVVLEGKVKSEARNTICLGSRHNFQTFDDTGVTLVLQPRVFTLGVFTNDGKIDVGVTSRESRQGLAEHNGGVNVELLTHSDVPGNMTGLRDGGEEDPLSVNQLTLLAGARVGYGYVYPSSRRGCASNSPWPD